MSRVRELGGGIATESELTVRTTRAPYGTVGECVVGQARGLQLRAEAHQVLRNDLAFVHGNGGIFSEECSVILGRER